MTGRDPGGTDPTSRLLRTIALVVVVGGFLVFQVPEALLDLASGEVGRQIGGLLSLAFWGWLTWRLVELVRAGRPGPEAGYWLTSAVGFFAFFLVFAGFEVKDVADGDFDARSLPFTVIVLVVSLTSLLAYRRRTREASTEGASS